MAHTNSTPNYALPQFIPTDKPAWLTDINVAFSSIDTGIDNAKDTADNAQNDATQAISDAAAAASTATGADAKAGGAVASIAETFEPTNTYALGEYVMYNNLLYICTTAVEIPGAWTGSANWTRTTVDQIVNIEDAKIAALNGTTLVNDPLDPSVKIADRISALDNNKANKAISDITPNYVHANITTNNMHFHRFGDMLFFSGVFSGTSVPRYVEIFRLNNLSCSTTFVPLVSINNGYGYMEVYTSANGLSFRISNLPTDVNANTSFSGCVKLV